MLHSVALPAAHPQTTASARPPEASALAAYPRLQHARIALVHDYLFEQGGAENVVQALAAMLPHAPIYTSIYDPGSVSFAFASREVHTTFLQYLAREKRHAKALLPLYPLAFRSLDLSRYDLVLTSSSGFATGVRPAEGAVHVCYCHTPAHFIWNLRDYAQGQASGRLSLALCAMPLLPGLQAWDVHAAQRVGHFVANSSCTAARIATLYGRQSRVIHPPIRLSDWQPSDEIGDYYLIVSRLLPYKRIDIAVRAFTELGLPLRVIGDGPDRARLERLAGTTVVFEGRVPRHMLARRYAGCRAFVLPGAEDLGLTALEAQASGRPVLAFGASGAMETVVEGVSGAFFHEQSPEALADAVRQVDVAAYDPAAIRAHAAEFDVARFRERMLGFLEDALAGEAAVSHAGDVASGAGIAAAQHPAHVALSVPVLAVPTSVPRIRNPIRTRTHKRRVPWESVSKAVFDRSVAGVALVLLSPVFAAAALATVLCDGAPVFYRPRRVGQNGREFGLFKFRTMSLDAEQRLLELAHLNRGGGHMIRIPHDPRVTRVGRILRRLAIDELPQLLNVLRGEMSLVGPRPQSPPEVALYTPHERQRLRAIPGITGLWQVSARHNTDFAQWVALDLEYQETWSFWLDLMIMLRTPLAVAKGTGA
ncbi:MAG: sugar transferase [Ktedonobacterales bacterium]